MKLGKTASETVELLKQAYGDDALSRTTVFEWHRRFREGRQSAEDDALAGAPTSSSTPKSIHAVEQEVRADPRLSVRNIAEATGISYGRTQSILPAHLGMR